jgi:hypothetical protein
VNDRIRELAEQAELNVTLYFNKEKLNKFAELMVKECLEICKEKEQANLYGVREVENTIKQHFGVAS